MENKDLNKKIVEKFKLIRANSTDKELKNLHFKSVENFIFHLIQNSSNLSKEKSKLQEINEIRIKKMLLEYLTKIENQKFSEEEIVQNFGEYITPIGEHMNRHYKFSFSGGTYKFLQFFYWIIPTLIIDYTLYSFKLIIFPVFTISTVIYIIFKQYRKANQKKLYGPNY